MINPYTVAVKQRSFILLSLFALIYGSIIWRLYSIQITKNESFTTIAKKQYSCKITTKPPRGYIYDKNDTIIACNQPCYSLFVIPKTIQYPETLLPFLEKHYPDKITPLLDAVESHKGFLYIARNIDEQTYKKYEKQLPEDIEILEDLKRYYPYQEAFSQVIGKTDVDATGVLGLEQTFNALLQGSETIQTIKKDARINHFYFDTTTHVQGYDSHHLTTTIDADIQWKAYTILQNALQRLDAQEAAALIMNPETGSIEACVSCPSFDPNNTETLNLDYTQNRCISKSFEVGSVMKTFAALAALEESVVKLDEPFDCQNTRHTTIDGIRVRTVKAHGVLPFIDVISRSNNIGTVLATKRVGEKLYDYYTMLGFGNTSGIPLPGEHKGFVNHPANWSAYSIHSLSYGYEISATLLQLAQATSMIANGGFSLTPHIIKNQYSQQEKKQCISTKTIEDVKAILHKTITHGTGRRAQIPGFDVYGKTGTAYLAENGAYNTAKKLYTFIGWVEKDNYKRVITLYVKEAKKERYSATVAAPVFKKLAEMMLIHDHIA